MVANQLIPPPSFFRDWLALAVDRELGPACLAAAGPDEGANEHLRAPRLTSGLGWLNLRRILFRFL
jgi:hypothetical protein